MMSSKDYKLNYMGKLSNDIKQDQSSEHKQKAEGMVGHQYERLPSIDERFSC